MSVIIPGMVPGGGNSPRKFRILWFESCEIPLL